METFDNALARFVVALEHVVAGEAGLFTRLIHLNLDAILLELQVAQFAALLDYLII